MQITDVRIRKVEKEGKMKAVVSITIDEEFVVHDIKIIEGEKGLFIAMPSRKAADGEYRDIAHEAGIFQHCQNPKVEQQGRDENPLLFLCKGGLPCLFALFIQFRLCLVKGNLVFRRHIPDFHRCQICSHRGRQQINENPPTGNKIKYIVSNKKRYPSATLWCQEICCGSQYKKNDKSK